jgi:hypothetical protein
MGIAIFQNSSIWRRQKEGYSNFLSGDVWGKVDQNSVICRFALQSGNLRTIKNHNDDNNR